MIEIEEDKKVKSTWAKALAQSDGDRDKAESLYIKLRVHKFKTEHIIYMEEKNNVMRDEKEKLKALKVNKEKIDSKSKIFKYVYDIPADIKIQLISKYTLGNPYEDNEQIKYIFKDKSTGEECVLKYCDNFYVLFSNDKRKEEIFHIKNKSIYLVKNNEVENNVPKPKNLDYATKFLEKYDCTEKSINVIIDNKIIRVRNKLNYICFDRFTNEEFIIPVEKFEEISSRENTYIEKTSNGIICSYCETLNSIDNSHCYRCNEPITLNSLIETYKRK